MAAMKKRSFDALSVTVTGAQDCESRFGKRRRGNESEDVPPVAQWRCNLTGLSQTSNLYFVAYSDRVYVYQPQYPLQSLPEQPALIIPSKPTSEDLRGYVDRRNPHAVNYLVVQLLGEEEVVATVRDDGDVDVILVRHIIQAIERRAESDNEIGLVADDVKPFFRENVGMSAWGLAIHSQARIIAVSSNTRSINVYEFGLVKDEAKDEDVSAGRETDIHRSILNGESNIPYIAFCNTGDDPNGQWLLTTDITGMCRSFDLRQMRPVQKFRFGAQSVVQRYTNHDCFHAGWIIMFLDQKSFIPESNVHAALGLAGGEKLPEIKRNLAIWDIGATVAHVPDCLEKFSGRRAENGVEVVPPEPAEDRSDGDSPSVGDFSGPDVATHSPVLESDESAASGESSGYEADNNLDGTEDRMYYRASQRICSNALGVFNGGIDICDDLPCPIMHASVRNCYLLQPTRCGKLGISGPMVGFAHALKQLVHEDIAHLNLFERLNMYAYIPSMGVVVLASQKGRAVVLSLTKLAGSTKYPPEMSHHSYKWSGTNYTMRIECILPYGSQEGRDSQRPCAPLMGIATGPIQGTEHLLDEHKRWRLLMAYTDHSVLSYEISRRSAGGSDIDLQGIMV